MWFLVMKEIFLFQKYPDVKCDSQQVIEQEILRYLLLVIAKQASFYLEFCGIGKKHKTKEDRINRTSRTPNTNQTFGNVTFNSDSFNVKPNIW